MEGLKLIWRAFKSLGVVPYRIIVLSNPFYPVPEPTVPLGTLDNPLHFPLRFLIINNRKWRLLVLA